MPSAGALVLYFIIKQLAGSFLSAAEWTLLAFDILFTLGAVIMAVVVFLIGYRRLAKLDSCAHD